MLVKTVAWALLLSLAPLVSAGMYSKPVIELNAKAFRNVMADEHAAIVAFVAPWCGYCQKLAPEYQSAAASLAPLIPFYTVDCDAQENKRLCSEYGVQGFPTLKLFPRGGKGAPRDFQGERARGPLVEGAKNMIPERVKKLRVDNGGAQSVDKFLKEKTTLPHVLLVHPSAPSIPFMWKVVAHRFSGKIHSGYIKDTSQHVVLDHLSIAPEADKAKVVFFDKGVDVGQGVEYDGPLKFDPIYTWLTNALNGDIAPASDKQTKEDSPNASRSPDNEEATSGSSSTAPQPTEDSEARRRRLQAKMDEIERRDRVRRERLALLEAQRQAAHESAGIDIEQDVTAQPDVENEHEEGTPVETADDAEPEEGVDAEEKEHEGVQSKVESDEPSPLEGNGVIDDEGASRVDAPEPEAGEDAEDEEAARLRDEL